MPRGRKSELAINCNDCGNLLLSDNIVLRNGHPRNRCKECFKLYVNKVNREVRARNPNSMRESNLKRYNNFDSIEFDKLFKLQDGKCVICKLPCEVRENLSVDHDHSTNEVRGLLCSKCNWALGLLNEDEDILWNMLEYLKKHVWMRAS
jgi:DNA-directed RNA polymerase subunit M/transcription elongation factor TFIIS